MSNELNEILSKHLVGRHDQSDHTKRSHTRKEHGTKKDQWSTSAPGYKRLSAEWQKANRDAMTTLGGGLGAAVGGASAYTASGEKRALRGVSDIDFKTGESTNHRMSSSSVRAADKPLKRRAKTVGGTLAGLAIGAGVGRAEAGLGNAASRGIDRATKTQIFGTRNNTDKAIREAYRKRDEKDRAKKKVKKSWDSMVVSKGE